MSNDVGMFDRTTKGRFSRLKTAKDVKSYIARCMRGVERGEKFARWIQTRNDGYDAAEGNRGCRPGGITCTCAGSSR